MARNGPRTAEKRAEILRRAATVFRAKGFFGAGMREIARGVGMAPGALYYYFASKEDLLHACQLLTLDRLLASAIEIAADDAPAEDKIRRLIRAHLLHSLGELGGSLAHVEFHALPPDKLAGVVAQRDRYEAAWRGIIESGIESGALGAANAKLATLTLLGALNWAAVWWRPEGEQNLEELATAMADTLLGGLKR
ncbi:MAG: TetR family transcriptional regulator [Planctomycetota bacterium]